MPLTSGIPKQRGGHASPAPSVAMPRPAVVELVGPAGAGKTAVLRAIRARDPGVRAGFSINRLRFAGVLVRHTLSLLPMSAELLWRRPRSWWPAMVHILRLRTLPSALAAAKRSGHRAIVLDEGPVFSLTRLIVFQDAHRCGGRLTQEWQRAYTRWIDGLDGIVWLDAPDTVLVRRIRERDKAHRIKGKTDDEILRFLRRYRDAFQDVLVEFRSAGRARITEIDSSGQTADQLAAALLSALPPPSSDGARPGEP